MGKILIILGVILMLAGLIIEYSNRLPFFGKLPGDITIERENFRFYFPFATSIVISILISLIIFLINKSKN
jgi:hypothetical protein